MSQLGFARFWIDLQGRLRALLWLLPAAAGAGLLVGVGAAVYGLLGEGAWAHGLWRTAAISANATLNQALWSAFSLAVFLAAATALQMLLGRRLVPGLRVAVGVVAFYPVFLLIVWLYTDYVVAALHLQTHKLPELVRKNNDLGRFLIDNFLNWLDLSQARRLLLQRSGWTWPSLALAVPFAVWFDRTLAALWAVWRRRVPAPPDRAPRRWGMLGAVALCAAGAAALGLNILARAAALTTREPRPNVILISIDTLRADRLGCYGNDRARTPALDLLAKNGVVFEEAVSNASWTLPGHGAMLTGVQPTALGLFKVTDRLSRQALTMAEVFREHGFDAGAIVSYILLDRVYGFDQGFTHFDYEDMQPAKAVVDKALAFIGPRQFRKFFLFLHLYDAHWPYEPTEATAHEFWPHYIGPELRELIDTGDYAQHALKVVKGPTLFNDYSRAMYDGEIHDIDVELGRLFRFLLDKRLIDRTAIVVTSDHGEQFLEHGLFGHGLTLYDEELRVPLIMRYPHLLPAGQRVKGQVQMLDIFPTLLGLAGLDAQRYRLGGRDLLLMAAAGAATPTPMISETSMSGDPRYAVRDGKHKLVTPYALDFGHGLKIDKPEEAFDLSADPGETQNLAPDHPKMADVLRQQMAEQMARVRATWGAGEGLTRSQALSAEEIERLRSLGYIK